MPTMFMSLCPIPLSFCQCLLAYVWCLYGVSLPLTSTSWVTFAATIFRGEILLHSSLSCRNLFLGACFFLSLHPQHFSLRMTSPCTVLMQSNEALGGNAIRTVKLGVIHTSDGVISLDTQDEFTWTHKCTKQCPLKQSATIMVFMILFSWWWWAWNWTPGLA